MEQQKIFPNPTSIVLPKQPERKLKFSDWYFQESLEVALRPEFFVPREKYFQDLHNRSIGGSMHTLVFGAPGQGKTVSTKIFFDDWKRRDNNVHVIYVNCKEADSQTKIFKTILNEMGKTYPLVHEIAKENDRRAIREFVINIPKDERWYLILDEIDVPIKFDQTKGEWLTVFFRAEHGSTVEPTPRRWFVIMITNKVAFEDNLDRNERQHIEHLSLAPYTLTEIYQILNKRVQTGIKNGDISEAMFAEQVTAEGYKYEPLVKIAKYVLESDLGANMRIANQLIVKVGNKAVALNSPITEELINQAGSELEIDMLLEDVHTITKGAQFFYYSVLIYLNKKTKESKFYDGNASFSHSEFMPQDIFPFFLKFCSENKFKTTKSLERNSQRYLAEGIDIGIYRYLRTEQRFKRYEVLLDPKEIFRKATHKNPQFNFDISII